MENITVQKVLATLGVVLALIGAADFVPYAFWVGVAGLAFAAAGNAIAKYAGNAVFTVFGVAVAVVGVITPSLADVNELWGRIGLLVGAVIAALGKGLFGFEPKNDEESK